MSYKDETEMEFATTGIYPHMSFEYLDSSYPTPVIPFTTPKVSD